MLIQAGGNDAATIRKADRRDIAGMHRVRLAVRENRLGAVLDDADYLTAIETTGRGWVVESSGEIAGFAVGNARTGNIWALFVDPRHERRGYGRRLHDTMLRWLFASGVERAWLTTEDGTRARRFYEAAGWRPVGANAIGEVVLEMRAGDFQPGRSGEVPR
jgi:GNAT superfamily N-acetyltransferase